MAQLELHFCYRFEAAHRFSKATSRCATPHGHSWYASLIFEAPSAHLDECEMTEDFVSLKTKWKSFITETVDHSFFHHYQDPILPSLTQNIEDFRGLPFPGDPTTELIAALFLRKTIALYRESSLRPLALEIQETPTNKVRLDRSALECIEAQLQLPQKFSKAWWTNAEIDSRQLESTS